MRRSNPSFVDLMNCFITDVVGSFELVKQFTLVKRFKITAHPQYAHRAPHEAARALLSSDADHARNA